MEEEGGMRLSKRFNDKDKEVDYKTKSGTAWSHNFLNQKPWHPLSYPNQRRKWIAEQTHANHQRRSDEVAREYAQEQEFFRQTSLISKKEKEKVELMQAVSFMYVRPPGYNAESAKAAEISDEQKKHSNQNDDPDLDVPSTTMPLESIPTVEKKKSRPKDVFGRALPTEEEFDILKNAPKYETGVAGRAKPFALEIRNVKCIRCGTFGHQSGDRECLLKDAIMPNEESRLKRDDPLTAILAHTDSFEPLNWELKQKPGTSPVRGGFKPDDPNQQIVAEDIFDEYGGFLGEVNIPKLLTNFSSSKPRKKKSNRKGKHKRLSASCSKPYRSSSDDQTSTKHKKHKKKKVRVSSKSCVSDDKEIHQHWEKCQKGSENSHSNVNDKMRKHYESNSSDDSDIDRHNKRRQEYDRHDRANPNESKCDYRHCKKSGCGHPYSSLSKNFECSRRRISSRSDRHQKSRQNNGDSNRHRQD